MKHNRRVAGLLALIVVLMLAAVAGYAQAPGANYATVASSASPSSIKPGGHAVLAISIDIAPGFHINSAKPADPALIPTTLQLGQTTGLVAGPIGYPANKIVRESYSPKPMLVYMDHAVIHVPVAAPRSVKPGRYLVKGTLIFQGCNHTACFPPKTIPISASITVK